jgi:hypothetical protein
MLRQSKDKRLFHEVENRIAPRLCFPPENLRPIAETRIATFGAKYCKNQRGIENATSPTRNRIHAVHAETIGGAILRRCNRSPCMGAG